ncbi:MAG: hypothetical protein K1X94_10230 [Sandaracinaceae bacterium]|nr:hypothetical protein [Sandaracinaceae bacterium]
MNDEARNSLIARAARAHRDASNGRSPRAEGTRARVLATHQETSSAVRWLAVAAALVVFVGAPTAWAWSTGRLAEWLDAAPSRGAPRDPLPTSPSAHGSANEEPARVEPPPRVESPDRVDRVESPDRVETPARVEPTRDDPSDEEALTALDPARPAPDPRERRAFERADSLHTQRDFEAALGAWADYLAEYPDGRFAIEARYERAICLVRLGRDDEARAALMPFAEGRFGRYREREARALLEALGGGATPR